MPRKWIQERTRSSAVQTKEDPRNWAQNCSLRSGTKEHPKNQSWETMLTEEWDSSRMGLMSGETPLGEILN